MLIFLANQENCLVNKGFWLLLTGEMILEILEVVRLVSDEIDFYVHFSSAKFLSGKDLEELSIKSIVLFFIYFFSVKPFWVFGFSVWFFSFLF